MTRPRARHCWDLEIAIIGRARLYRPSKAIARPRTAWKTAIVRGMQQAWRKRDFVWRGCLYLPGALTVGDPNWQRRRGVLPVMNLVYRSSLLCLWHKVKS